MTYTPFQLGLFVVGTFLVCYILDVLAFDDPEHLEAIAQSLAAPEPGHPTEDAAN
jgi:hypothetical protein